MSSGEPEIGDDPIGPGTDLVISLFCTFLLLTVLAGALKTHIQRLTEGGAKKEAPTKTSPKGQVIVLDPVRDGLQYFSRKSANLDPASYESLVSKLEPLREAVSKSEGKLVIHIIGHASPEPFGQDQGGANFELALNRAMSVTRLLHSRIGLPFECLRVHGYGRAESKALSVWLTEHPLLGTKAWDDDYRMKREAEKREWKGGEQDWSYNYDIGNTELGKNLATERRVVLQTEFAENSSCARALEIVQADAGGLSN